MGKHGCDGKRISGPPLYHLKLMWPIGSGLHPLGFMWWQVGTDNLSYFVRQKKVCEPTQSA